MIKYKESGVGWIGQIPEDWEVDRIKKVLKERNEKNDPIKTENILSLTNDRGVIPYSEKGAIGNNAKEDLTGYKLAYPNDLVLNSMNVVIGSVGVSKYFGAVSPVYYMLNLRNENESIEFYNYIFQTKEFQKYLKGFGNGILDIRMRIPMINLNSVKIPIVAPDKQHKIVTFLDKKCAQIDELIKLQEQEIEKLKEYKQSIITEVVTKGLDKNAKMKDSGIDWIGEIPEHWKCCRLKNYCNVISKGETPKEISVVKDDNFGVRFLKCENLLNGRLQNLPTFFISKSINDKMKRSQLKENDILFVIAGATIGKTALVEKEFLPANINQAVCFIRIKEKYLKFLDYIHYFITSNCMKEYFNLKLVKSAQPNISMEDLWNFPILLPNIDEQFSLVEKIKIIDKNIYDLISIKQEKITKLQDYKKSLICEYVTGKKEI